jgi:hypothetical protein
MAQINFKVTTWELTHIPDELVDIVKKGIEDGTITSSMDLYDIPELKEIDFDLELSDDGVDQLSVEENNGEYTIELRTDKEYELITTNLNSNK